MYCSVYFGGISIPTFIEYIEMTIAVNNTTYLSVCMSVEHMFMSSCSVMSLTMSPSYFASNSSLPPLMKGSHLNHVGCKEVRSKMSFKTDCKIFKGRWIRRVLAGSLTMHLHISMSSRVNPWNAWNLRSVCCFAGDQMFENQLFLGEEWKRYNEEVQISWRIRKLMTACWLSLSWFNSCVGSHQPQIWLKTRLVSRGNFAPGGTADQQ